MFQLTRNVFALFIIISLTSVVFAADNFTFAPEKPNPGEEIIVTFDASDTDLSEADKITMYIYLFAADLQSTESFEMKNKNGKWEASFKTNEDNLGAAIKFVYDEIFENNKGKGFFIHLYNANGGLLPGSKAGMANALNSWGVYYLDLESDLETSLNLYEEDFKTNHAIKKDFLSGYFAIISRARPMLKDSIITAALEEFELNNPQEESELTLLTNWYGAVKHQTKAESYKAKLEEKFPEADYLANIKLGEIYNEKDLVQKETLIKAFVEKYSSSKLLPSAYSIYINALRTEGEFVKADEFIKPRKDKISPYTYYSLVSKMFEAENLDLKTAKEISKMGADKAKNELENSTEGKANYQSKSDWEKDRKYLLGLNLYNYGKVLYKEENKEEAKEILKDAFEYTGGDETDVNELFAQCLLETGEAGEALEILSSSIKNGKGNETMKELLKNAYTKEKGEDGGEEFLKNLEDAAGEKMKAALKKKMKNDPAPEFTLTDMEGNKVSLADLKGKIIIIDFWATWCGPCKSSFPGMQKAVNKYAEDENVKFLFINTWERAENKLQNAKDFIQQNNYTFKVLMDENNEVITKYKVSGIPTKFILGKDGNIKFISIGFSGSVDQLVDELSTMISMLK
ncbi:MAG: TlpA family protein disulfide reductase [Ignavibacteria bacterium]|nr:TlpA family protein disulfide reductase [Ignavibacteria bacterium]